jgi:hypothetical protein
MVKIVDGKPVRVPDDARITPELKVLRDRMNDLLRWLQSPAAKEVERQYREIRVSDLPAFDWYPDPKK